MQNSFYLVSDWHTVCIYISMRRTKSNGLIDFLDLFPSEESCIEAVARIRWPSGPVCPKCDSKPCAWRKDMRINCASCHHNFSVRSGTMFHSSNIPLRKWFAAMWLFANHSKSISSVQLGKDLGVTQSTAWKVLKKLREAVVEMDQEKLSGDVEADEAYVGGLEKNKHWKNKNATGFKIDQKTPVLGVRKRDGEVRLKAVKFASTSELDNFVRSNVEEGSVLYTDELPAYGSIDGYDHRTVNHSKKQYVDGDKHTNSIESVWAIVKRAWKGTYHWWSKKYMDLYIAEFEYRFNSNANGKDHLEKVQDLLVRFT